MPIIPASSQFAAVAYLRWRLFVNALRGKGGTGELVARVLVYPIAALFLLLPTAGAGFGSWYAVRQGHPGLLTAIFWIVFALQMLVSINLAPAGLTFDPESLIRFPLAFPRYLTIRLLLGLLAPSTIAGSLALAAAALGVTLARPSLAPAAFAAGLSLALANLLFLRMIFAWVDRWLSTRRAREVVTGVILLGSLGLQYLNITFNHLGHRSSPSAQMAKYHALAGFYRGHQGVLALLPPSLAANAIRLAALHSGVLSLAALAGVLAWAALFLAVFALRTHREYRGENLSHAPANAAPAPLHTTHKSTAAPHPASPDRTPLFNLSAPVAAALGKEFLYVRRNIAQFYGLLGPVVMVFLFAGRVGSLGRTGLLFPLAVAYSLLGIGPLSYNLFGLDATGMQFYFLAPISLRSIVLAKNLFLFAIAVVQLALVYLVIAYTAGVPSPLLTLETLLWIVFATLVNAVVGNIRSITTPKKLDPGKLARRHASQLSSLLCLAVLLSVTAAGAGVLALSTLLHRPWLPLPIFLVLAAGALALYLAGLNRVDALAYNHREQILEELTKAA